MLVRLVGLTLLLSFTLGAQFHTFPDAAYFKEQWAPPPLAVDIESASLLEDFVVGEQLELSLRAYIELVMANNPDVNLQKLSVFEQENAIQAAFGRFDPTLTASFNSNRSTRPTNDQLEGASVLTNLNQQGFFTFNQTLETGTNYSVGVVGGKTASNSVFQNFNPSITQTLRFTVSQPLLRGRGRYIQRIPIMVAESRLRLTEEQVRDNIIGLLFQAENAYWNAVDAREQLKIQQNSLELARVSLERAKKELDLGAISPLDIFQPEQQFAAAQVRVTQERYRLRQAEDVVRRWIGADLDPDFRHVSIVLTASTAPPAQTPEMDPEEKVELALRRRPEIRQSQRALEIDDLEIEAATNELRPDLALSANYSVQGRGGNFFERTGLGGSAAVLVPGGFPDALDQLLQFRFPTYGFGLTLQLPLRNRRAAADLANATIQKRRDLYALRSVEQEVRLDVLNAVAGVELSKAAVQQASIARDFAQKRLDAEQQKYDLGVQDIFFVLTAQNDLVDAEAQVLTQSISYRRSTLTLLRATGELLGARGVVVR